MAKLLVITRGYLSTPPFSSCIYQLAMFGDTVSSWSDKSNSCWWFVKNLLRLWTGKSRSPWFISHLDLIYIYIFTYIYIYVLHILQLCLGAICQQKSCNLSEIHFLNRCFLSIQNQGEAANPHLFTVVVIHLVGNCSMVFLVINVSHK